MSTDITFPIDNLITMHKPVHVYSFCSNFTIMTLTQLLIKDEIVDKWR
jgi:hypothetical protein